jgi:hypothetical protein
LPSSLPPSMLSECILSVQWRSVSVADRHAIEAQLRSLRVPALPPPQSRPPGQGGAAEPKSQGRETARPTANGATPSVASRTALLPAGPSVAPAFDGVHYCQAYSIDWQGEATPSDAATQPRPQYALLLSAPLPLPPPLPVCSPSACFNCGKEGHQSRACPRPKSAMPLFAAPARMGPRKAPTFQGRYFDAEPISGSMSPGLLSPELQAMLGMRALDPPPYLARMHRIGFPPGYIGIPQPVHTVVATSVHTGTSAPVQSVQRPLASGDPPITAGDSGTPSQGMKVDTDDVARELGTATEMDAATAMDLAPELDPAPKLDPAAETDRALKLEEADSVLRMYREAPGVAPGGVAAPKNGVGSAGASALGSAAAQALPTAVSKCGAERGLAAGAIPAGGHPSPAAGLIPVGGHLSAAAGGGKGAQGGGGAQAGAAVLLVQLPGVNAPPPQGTDWRRWGWRPEQPVTKVARLWR